VGPAGFIPGETVEDAIFRAGPRRLEAMGLPRDIRPSRRRRDDARREADVATRDYLEVVHAVLRAKVERNISLKAHRASASMSIARRAVDNLRKILEGGRAGRIFFVRVDMENSSHTAVTLDVFETLWQQGYPPDRRGAAVGALPQRGGSGPPQTALRPPRIRLVKGRVSGAQGDRLPEKRPTVDAAYAQG